MKKNKLVIIFTVVIFIFASIFLIYFQFTKNSQTKKINVELSKIIILEKVRSLSKLQTTEYILQRDLEVTLDLGNLQFLGKSILENKRTQKVAITGSVVAGIDFNKLNENNLFYDKTNNSLSLELPNPEILGVNFFEDKLYIIEDNVSFLFRLNTLSNSERIKLNQELQQQIIKQGKQALINGACESQILEKAKTNGIEEIKKIMIFTQTQLNEIKYPNENLNCSFEY